MLFNNAELALIADINAKNGTFFKPGQLLFGPGQDISEITPAPSTTKNSSVLLRVNDGAPYTGQTRIFYDRLDLAKVFEHTPLNTYAKLRAFRPTKIHDLVPAINDCYGLNITTDDILDGDLNLTNGNGQVTIVANPRSLGWKGEVVMTVAPGDAKLEQWMTDTDLEGIKYPSGQVAKGQAEVYSYRYDATTYWGALHAIEVPEGGMLPNQAIADMLTEITGDSWVFEAGDYSLVGSLIKYNGVNTNDRPSNPNFSHVLEIVLGGACANFAGTLRIHYNSDNAISSVATVTGYGDRLSALAAYDPRYNVIAGYDVDRINPYLYTASIDYSAAAADISSIPWQATWTAMSSANASRLASGLKRVDGKNWNISNNVDFSLLNGYVRYNGPVANIPDSALHGLTREDLIRPGFSHVMLLNPQNTSQTNMWYGLAVIHYNA